MPNLSHTVQHYQALAREAELLALVVEFDKRPLPVELKTRARVILQEYGL